jgi:hypothetical protein
LSPRSIAYALSVLGAMFRWLIEQRYVFANPFAGLKVRGAQRNAGLDASHVFTAGEWDLVRTIADGLEWSHGWTVAAAQRLRFLLDFGYATGLRADDQFAFQGAPDMQAERHQPARLPRILPDSHRGPQNQSHRRPAALERGPQVAHAIHAAVRDNLISATSPANYPRALDQYATTSVPHARDTSRTASARRLQFC